MNELPTCKHAIAYCEECAITQGDIWKLEAELKALFRMLEALNGQIRRKQAELRELQG